jgi:hypothetical protein
MDSKWSSGNVSQNKPIHGRTIPQDMNYRFTIFTLLILCSCENPVRFESPQPEGRRDENSIPRKLIGQYRSLEDSSILTITSRDIISRSDWRARAHLTELDSAEQASIHGDTTFTVTMDNSHSVFKVTGDSVHISMNSIDTIFSLDRGDKIRKLKGYYLVNERWGEREWKVSKIGRTKHGIIIGKIFNQDDLGKLRELTNTDSVYNFNPTKQQMKEFIRDGGFSNNEVFVEM